MSCWNVILVLTVLSVVQADAFHNGYVRWGQRTYKFCDLGYLVRWLQIWDAVALKHLSLQVMRRKLFSQFIGVVDDRVAVLYASLRVFKFDKPLPRHAELLEKKVSTHVRIVRDVAPGTGFIAVPQSVPHCRRCLCLGMSKDTRALPVAAFCKYREDKQEDPGQARAGGITGPPEARRFPLPHSLGRLCARVERRCDGGSPPPRSARKESPRAPPSSLGGGPDQHNPDRE